MYYLLIAFQVLCILAIIGAGLYCIDLVIRSNIKPMDYGTKGYLDRTNDRGNDNA